jgi:riboflavin synthase
VFTGLVEDTGRISRVEVLPSGRGRRLAIDAKILEEVQPIGASIAVDGVCLTVTTAERGRVTVEAGPETLERTTLGKYTDGQRVNLERPVRVGDRLGGHIVSGHVDGVGAVRAKTPRGEAIDVEVEVPAPLLRYVIEKGSITIDGISLTVNGVSDAGISVSIIPHTQTATTLTTKDAGAAVNLEVDLIGKYVERLLGPRVGA